MKKAAVAVVLLWLVLNVGIGLLTDAAMFYQMSPGMKGASFWHKVAASEVWATLEFLILIPANRLGNRFLTAAQVSLSSFIFDFVAQLWTNKFWLKLPTTPDDYVAMVVILGGMAVSTYKMLE